jgi:cell wall-associated NlpC family hydrolase
LQLLKAYALSYLGTVYSFGTNPGGGDDPIRGFDCSGFASELMRASGVASWNFRTNAQGVYNHLWKNQGLRVVPELGAFAFFGKEWDQIVHVAFCLDSVTMVEAGGGDSTTTTEEIAAHKNAFVRLRPVTFRKDYLGCVRPMYPKAI